MGESLVEIPKVDNKMDESVAIVPCFQQSVSFGRFEHDSLCWEKWSTFPTNKYLEEVEKCSTPGSVAQKKAYFEAHYKKIAARKLLQEQERKEEAVLANSQGQSLVCNSSEAVLDYVTYDQESVRIDQLENDVPDSAGEVSVHVGVKSGSVDVFTLDNEVANHPSGMHEHTDAPLTVGDLCEVADLPREKPEHVYKSNDGVNFTDEVREEVKIEVIEHIGERHDDADAIDEVVKYEVVEHKDVCENGNDVGRGRNVQTQEEGAIQDLCSTTKIPELENSTGPVSVTPNMSSVQRFQDGVSTQEKVKRSITEGKSIILSNLKKMEKATLVKKTIDAQKDNKKLASAIPRRSIALMPKSPVLSTPESSKPELAKTARSAHHPLNKNENDSTQLTSTRRIGHESKKVVPKSLHMSINLPPAKTHPTSSTTKKPLIMESMGDKDIVKRAFKAFQNVTRVPQSSLVKSTARNQSASGNFERKGSPASTLKKKSEGTRRAVKTDITLNGQLGTKKMSLSAGVTKNVGAEQRHAKSVATSFGPPVQLHGNTKKAYLSPTSRRLEINPKSKVSEATLLQPKVKVEKAATIKSRVSSVPPRTKLSLSYN